MGLEGRSRRKGVGANPLPLLLKFKGGGANRRDCEEKFTLEDSKKVYKVKK